MDQSVRHVVIPGGGSADGLTAAVLAAEHNTSVQGSASENGLRITLIQSPEVSTIGVGEGTWPTMRDSYQFILYGMGFIPKARPAMRHLPKATFANPPTSPTRCWPPYPNIGRCSIM